MTNPLDSPILSNRVAPYVAHERVSQRAHQKYLDRLARGLPGDQYSDWRESEAELYREELGKITAEVIKRFEKLVPPPKEPEERPSLFVGSSKEGKRVAEAIQVNLDDECEVRLWNQEVFMPGKGTLESLLKESEIVDFAVMLLTPDDQVVSRGESLWSPRDNVLFELGLFAARLGIDRTFIVNNQNPQLKLPSDLSGITRLQSRLHSTRNVEPSNV